MKEEFRFIEVCRRAAAIGSDQPGPWLWVVASGWENIVPIATYRDIVVEALKRFSEAEPAVWAVDLMMPYQCEGMRAELRDPYPEANDAAIVAKVAAQIARLEKHGIKGRVINERATGTSGRERSIEVWRPDSDLSGCNVARIKIAAIGWDHHIPPAKFRDIVMKALHTIGDEEPRLFGVNVCYPDECIGIVAEVAVQYQPKNDARIVREVAKLIAKEVKHM